MLKLYSGRCSVPGIAPAFAGPSLHRLQSFTNQTNIRNKLFWRAARG